MVRSGMIFGQQREQQSRRWAVSSRRSYYEGIVPAPGIPEATVTATGPFMAAGAQ